MSPINAAEDLLWYQCAKHELGVREQPGRSHNARILEYHQATRLRATEDEVPWCAAFVCWCLEKAGVASTKSASARSYLKWGVPLASPVVGAVCILARGDASAGQGHVAFFAGYTPNGAIKLLGGNQQNRVCVQTYPADRLLAVRWPDGVSVPRVGP